MVKNEGRELWGDLKHRAAHLLSDLFSFLLVATPIALLAGFVWLANQPDAAVFVALSEQPIIGGPIDRLRDYYRSPESEPAAAVARGDRPRPAEESEMAAAAIDRPETVFVGGGAVLRSEPLPDAPEVARTTRIESLRLLERRDRWVRVEWPPTGRRVRTSDQALETRQGWVDLEARRRQTPPLGNEPSRPAPLSGRAADPELLDLARDMMSGVVQEGLIGPYSVLHDLESKNLFERFERSVERVEGAYRARFGVTPGDQPRETILIFRSRQDYERFSAARFQLSGVETMGHAGSGLMALHSEESDPRLIEMTLLHEVTHQLNRRALGPALPPWLEEGLCEELSEGGWAVDHKLSFEDWVRSFRLDFGTRYRLTGPFASLDAVATASLSSELPTGLELVAFDWRSFVEDRGALNYAASGWLLRYLLDGEEGRYREGFRSYLASVAAGEPPSGTRLVNDLGLDWVELDAGFRSYVFARARALGAPAVTR